MGLLNSAISNLLGGVSQQAPSLRGASNCEVQTNAYPSPVNGLVKRPPTQFLTDSLGASFNGSNTLDAATHLINRDATERYLVTISGKTNADYDTDDPISVWDLVNNVSVPVHYMTGSIGYLNAADPTTAFSFATAGDVTFIANKEEQGIAHPNISPAKDGNAMVHVRQGAYDTKYHVAIDGATVTHETHKTAENAAQTDGIAGSLVTLLEGGAATATSRDTIVLPAANTQGPAVLFTHNGINYYQLRLTTKDGMSWAGQLSYGTDLVGKYVTIETNTGDAIGWKKDPGLHGGQIGGSTLDVGDYHKVSAHAADHTWIELEGLARDPSVLGTGNCTFRVVYTTSTTYPGFSFRREGSTIMVSKDDGTHFKISTSDSVGDTYIKSFNGETQYFADLPELAEDGFKIAITGHAESDIDDYYVKFNAESGASFGGGHWVEDVGFEVPLQLSKSQMPHLLIRQADGSFLFMSAQGRSGGNYFSDDYPFLTDSDADDTAFVGAGGWVNNGNGTSSLYTEGLIASGVIPFGTTVAVKDPDGYWREYTTSGGQTAGGGGSLKLNFTDDPDWSIAPGAEVKLYYSGASASTAYAKYVWQHRKAGDEETNPMPNFWNQPINDIFFYENRLGILSGEKVTLSEAGEFFNFFRTTVIDLLDTAPIEVVGSSNTVNTLRHAKPFNGNLLLFGDNTQFMLGSGNDALTPQTVSMTQVGNYECDPNCSPTIGGNSVYFAYPRGRYGGLQELVIQDADARAITAYDLTDSVPSYVENPLRDIVAIPQENLIVGLPDPTDGNMEDLYLYKYLDRGNERVQSAWFKFSFALPGETDDTRQIIGIHTVESTLYIVSRFTDGTYGKTMIHKMDFSTDGVTDLFDLPPLVDDIVSYLGTDGDVTASHDDITDITTFTIPYSGIGKNANDFTIITKFHSGDDGGLATTPTGGTFTSEDETLLTLNGDQTALHVWIGVLYTMTYTYAQPIFKGPSSGGGSSLVTSGRYQIHSADIVFHDTNTFDVAVAVQGRSNFSYTYLADTTQVDVVTEGAIGLGEGNMRIPIHSKNDRYDFTITSISPFPVKLLSTEFEAQYNARSRRAGI